jgi:endonuclease/exonuclease/phosphatase family metal-dependent hydrolase
MKLIQLNIWYGKLVGNVLRFLQREQPDILCLQEMCSSPDGRTMMFDTMQELQKEFSYPHVYFSPVFSFQCMGLGVRYGNAILSRAAFKSAQTVFTRHEYMENYRDGVDEDNIRNFQHAAVDTGGGILHILNHHGHWAIPKGSNAETDRQLGILADYAARLDGPVIVTGDMNLAPQERSLRQLGRAGLVDLCTRHGIKTTRNILAWKQDEVSDYIFVNDKVKVKDFRVYEDLISDHAALGLEFEA